MWGGPFRHQSLRWSDLRRPLKRIRNQAGTRLLLRQTTKENFPRPSLGQDAHGFDVVLAPQLLRDLTRVPTPEAEITRTGEFDAEENAQFPCVRVSRGACLTRRNPSGRSAGREGFLSRHGSSRSVFDPRGDY